MRTKFLIFSILLLSLPAHAVDMARLLGKTNNLMVPGKATANVVPSASNTISRIYLEQDKKVDSLMALSNSEFKNRINEVNDLVIAFKFSTRSITERDGQIRKFLGLAARAIRIDDQNISIEYVYNRYTEYVRDFKRIMLDVSLSTTPAANLTGADIRDLQCNIHNMKVTRDEGQDNDKTKDCPIPPK